MRTNYSDETKAIKAAGGSKIHYGMDGRPIAFTSAEGGVVRAGSGQQASTPQSESTWTPSTPASRPAWGGNSNPMGGSYQQDRFNDLYQAGVDTTTAKRQAEADAKAMNRRWKEAPKVDQSKLINPSGAAIPGIPAPDQQTGPGPKINRLTGKPFGWRPGDPEPAAAPTPPPAATAKSPAAKPAASAPAAAAPKTTAAPAPAKPSSPASIVDAVNVGGMFPPKPKAAPRPMSPIEAATNVSGMFAKGAAPRKNLPRPQSPIAAATNVSGMFSKGATQASPRPAAPAPAKATAPTSISSAVNVGGMYPMGAAAAKKASNQPRRTGKPPLSWRSSGNVPTWASQFTTPPTPATPNRGATTEGWRTPPKFATVPLAGRK